MYILWSNKMNNVAHKRFCSHVLLPQKFFDVGEHGQKINIQNKWRHK